MRHQKRREGGRAVVVGGPDAGGGRDER
jgi:hypothetical protein